MPIPINSVRTRVIGTGSGYVAQMSTDNLMWYDLPDPVLLRRPASITDEDTLADKKYYATRVAFSAREIPSSGRVCWSSDAS